MEFSKNDPSLLGMLCKVFITLFELVRGKSGLSFVHIWPAPVPCRGSHLELGEDDILVHAFPLMFGDIKLATVCWLHSCNVACRVVNGIKKTCFKQAWLFAL